MSSSDHAAGRDQETGRAHAVLAGTAALPAPWAAMCGAPGGVVQGKWNGRRGLGSGDHCREGVRPTRA